MLGANICAYCICEFKCASVQIAAVSEVFACGFTQMEIEILAWKNRGERRDGGETCALTSN